MPFTRQIVQVKRLFTLSKDAYKARVALRFLYYSQHKMLNEFRCRVTQHGGDDHYNLSYHSEDIHVSAHYIKSKGMNSVTLFSNGNVQLSQSMRKKIFYAIKRHHDEFTGCNRGTVIEC